MDESRIRTVAHMRAVLKNTHPLEFTAAADAVARCESIAAVLKRLHYRFLGREDRGVVLQYLRHFSGFSRAQLTRVVGRVLTGRALRVPKGAPSNSFARRYTPADLDALAEVEREYGRLSGPAMVAVLRRMHQVYGDRRSSCNTFLRRTFTTTPSLSILVEAVVAAGLVDTLTGTGPFTVFAPTNSAFAALLAELGVTKDALLADTALLTNVLTYHVLPARVLKAEIPLNTPISTVQGQTIVINSSLQIIDQRRRSSGIVATEIFSTNGVVHVIDRVLLPN